MVKGQDAWKGDSCGHLLGSCPLFGAMWKREHFNLPASKMQKTITYVSLHR